MLRLNSFVSPGVFPHFRASFPGRSPTAGKLAVPAFESPPTSSVCRTVAVHRPINYLINYLKVKR